MRAGAPVVLVLTCAVAWVAMGCSTETDAPTSEAFEVTEVLSTDGESLGSIAFPTSCDTAATESLARGLALLHHMTYLESEAAFREAAATDPECALAYWGVAMTYAHPLWPDVITDDNLARGQALVERAMSVNQRTDREQAYIAALSAYYRGGARTSEAVRLAAFLEGWSTVHDRFPEDPEATLFSVLAQLAAAPASDRTYAAQEFAGTLAESISAQIPDHPGALHYTIHAYDFPPLADRALETARHYGEVAPEISHALHMTSHIFTRIGMWPESIAYNIRAADAASDRTPEDAVSLHHFHALDYLAYAYLQTADDDAAQQVLGALEALEQPFENHAGTAYTLAAVPSRLALERHRWAEASAVDVTLSEGIPWDQYPHLKAIPYFARAIGAARSGNRSVAREAINELSRLQDAAASMNMAYDWGIQVEIQRIAAEAWLEYEAGDRDRALQLMQQAAEKEASTDKNPVTPGEVLPAGELLADMMLDAGQYEEARQQYEAALGRSPNRLNSLYGAGRAAELAGDAETAAQYYERLLANAPDPAGDRPELDHARAFLR